MPQRKKNEMVTPKDQVINDSFTFVKKEDSSKIKDEAFNTKATTFAKDAFKRFCKNKSSVVGAVIIAILLLGSFIVPAVSPYDISTEHAPQKLLPPKVFDTGTGFWDGTKEYKDQPYDLENKAPFDFSKEAVTKCTVRDTEEYSGQYYKYAFGGYVTLSLLNTSTVETLSDKDNIFTYNANSFDITSAGNYTAKVDFGNDPTFGNATLTSHRVILQVGESTTKYKAYELSGWNTSAGVETYNLSKYIQDELHETALTACRLRIEGKAVAGKESFIMFKDVIFDCDPNMPNYKTIKEMCITDSNETISLVKLPSGKFPNGAWRSNADKYVAKATVTFCDFTYDCYLAQLGNIDFVIGKTIMDKYIANGWCEYDFNVGVKSFKILNKEKCPIVEVKNQSKTGDVYQLDTITIYYKYLGFDSMPKYAFGTNNEGKDLFTLALSCLKTSLLVAIISSAICFIVGLIWGSICGYFGGTVDIVMERFTDILSGVPWIVLMTLIMILLGQNVVVFAIALCLTGWIGTASTVRTQFYRFRDREYVLASRTLGASHKRLIFKHILPNGLGTIVTGSVLMIPGCIFSEATISYLGLGLQGVDSFGVILSENQVYLQSYPMLVVFPAIIISLLMISFNLFGNGLRDALNPTLKGGEQ